MNHKHKHCSLICIQSRRSPTLPLMSTASHPSQQRSPPAVEKSLQPPGTQPPANSRLCTAARVALYKCRLSLQHPQDVLESYVPFPQDGRTPPVPPMYLHRGLNPITQLPLLDRSSLFFICFQQRHIWAGSFSRIIGADPCLQVPLTSGNLQTMLKGFFSVGRGESRLVI